MYQLSFISPVELDISEHITRFCTEQQLLTHSFRKHTEHQQHITTLELPNISNVSKQLKQQLLSFCQTHHIEAFCYQPKTPPKLLCMDMDSTLIRIEVIDELAKLAGVGDKVARITEAAMQGELDFKQSLSARVAYLKGLPESIIKQVADNLPLSLGAEKLLQTLQQHNCKTAILSGGFMPFALSLKKQLNLDFVLANQLEIKNGKLTGKLFGEIMDAKLKQQTLMSLAQQYQIKTDQVLAIGDGANDLDMLAAAGTGVAFHAKPKVQQLAQHNINFLGLDSLLQLLIN